MRLPAPRPRKFMMGLEKTGKRGGMVPCGPAARPWLSATCSLSNTQRWTGYHSHASGSSVGMKRSGGHATGSKYWWRQGAGSMIGTCVVHPDRAAAPEMAIILAEPARALATAI